MALLSAEKRELCYSLKIARVINTKGYKSSVYVKI